MENQDFLQLGTVNSSLPISGQQQGNLFLSDLIQFPDTNLKQPGSFSERMDTEMAEAAIEIVEYSQYLHEKVLGVLGGMAEAAIEIVEYNHSLLESVLGQSDSLTGNNTPINSEAVLDLALTTASEQLESFATDEEFLDKMNLAFGEDWQPQEAQALIQDLASGEVPTIEVLPAAELDAKGAFGAFGEDTIYLSEKFLSENADDPEAVAGVLLEEIGHYVDQELSSGDSRGDEGDVFARLVQGETISGAELEAIKAENDRATLSLGEKESVELATPPYPGYLFEYVEGEPVGNGEVDADVETWQQAMVDQGYDLAVDGLYGPESKQIATQFQQDKGLAVDGIVGPETWEATFSAGNSAGGDTENYTALVSIPPDSEMNQGLTSPSSEYLEELLGDPTDPNSEGQQLQVTQDVGPLVGVTGLQPAVEALGRIFDKIEVEKPELYQQLDDLGMLYVRPIAGTNTYSNHSWGVAIDMRIGDTNADLKKDGQTYLGLRELYPYFNEEKFYWGAEFSTNEDPIHFEASEELIAQWEAEGRLTA